MKVILVDAYRTFVTSNGVDLDMQKLLDSYPVKKIIVTNATGEKMKEFGIVDMPYEIFSLNANPAKTDSAYFKTLLE